MLNIQMPNQNVSVSSSAAKVDRRTMPRKTHTQ